MVCEELLQPAVRQRMSEQPFDCRKGACRHIGTRIETLDNMLRMTDRSGQYLRFVTIGAVDLHDVGYQCHAVFGNVVEATNEGRDVAGAGAGGQNAIGTGVMGGTFAATALGIFYIPVFFVVVTSVFSFRWKRKKAKRRRTANIVETIPGDSHK